MSKHYEKPEETLNRIQSGQMGQNDVLCIIAFCDAGIPAEDITPRENVLTFNAWKAKGRRVAKGATSVRVTVWIPTSGKAANEPNEPQADVTTSDETTKRRGGMRPTTARLFHVSQTVAENAPKGTRPEAWQNPILVKAGTYDAIDAETANDAIVETECATC